MCQECKDHILGRKKWNHYLGTNFLWSHNVGVSNLQVQFLLSHGSHQLVASTAASLIACWHVKVSEIHKCICTGYTIMILDLSINWNLLFSLCIGGWFGISIFLVFELAFQRYNISTVVSPYTLYFSKSTHPSFEDIYFDFLVITSSSIFEISCVAWLLIHGFALIFGFVLLIWGTNS